MICHFTICILIFDMINTKAIKNRIKSVANTQKITKAMEMVSAAKMRKAVASALNTRTYAVLARALLEHLSELSGEAGYELLRARPVKNLLVVLISSNRGLCGAFNSNIFKKTALVLQNKNELSKQLDRDGKEIFPEEEVRVSIIGVGKKSADFAKKLKVELVAVFDTFGDGLNFEEILPVSKLIIEEYKKSIYDKVVVAFTDYKSSLNQIAKVRQLLPVSTYELEGMLAELGRDKTGLRQEAKEEIKDAANFSLGNYVFEPSEEDIVKDILPRLVEIQLYQSILESAASEHSARMLAMRNASDAAGEMIDELNLTFNKARQAAITQEIAEIAGGTAALE